MKQEKSTILVTAITYFVMLLMFIGMRIVFLCVDFGTDMVILDLISSIIVQFGFMFLLSLVMYSSLKRQKASKTFKDFGFNKISFWSILLCFVIGIVCYFLNMFVSSFFNGIVSFLGYEKAPSLPIQMVEDFSLGAFFLQVFAVAILPAFGEEFAHRGLLQNGFSLLGIKKAVILSSVMFGLMHLNIVQFFYATVLGFLMGLTVVISKSIFPAMIIHFTNNFLSIYFSFAGHNNWFLGGLPQKIVEMMYGSGNIFSFFLINALVFGGILLLLVFLFTSLLNLTRVRNVKKMLVDISNIDASFDPQFNPKTNKNLINLQTISNMMKEYNIKSLNSMVFTDIESRGRKTTLLEKTFIIAILVVGGIITAFTFIWGIL